MASFHIKVKVILLFFSAMVIGFSCTPDLDPLHLLSSSLAAERVPQIVPKGPRKKPQPVTSEYNIGAIYMPGWQSGNIFWHDLLGTQHARYPGK